MKLTPVAENEHEAIGVVDMDGLFGGGWVIVCFCEGADLTAARQNTGCRVHWGERENELSFL